MKGKKIKLFDPFIGKSELVAIKKTLNSKFWASGSGSGKVSEFERRFQKYTRSNACIAVNSGTAALHLALSLYDVKGKEIIIPSLSFISTAHAAIYNGGKPVFVDVESETLCIDPEKIENSISEKTKAILPVHFGGIPCNLKKISNLCKKHNLVLIEDAAHAAGALYNRKKIGSHGNAVCFSFHPVKNLAMPTGGAITLNDRSALKQKKILGSKRWCGISDRKGTKYDINDLGWNFYMNEFSAAIGLEQLKKLDKMNKKRKKIARCFSKEIHIKSKMPFNPDCSYHLYWVQVKNRQNFMKKMLAQGIETGIHYLPIHKMKFYKTQKKLPITELTGKRIVSLPIHPNLNDADVDKIIKFTNKFAK